MSALTSTLFEAYVTLGALALAVTGVLHALEERSRDRAQAGMLRVASLMAGLSAIEFIYSTAVVMLLARVHLTQPEAEGLMLAVGGVAMAMLVLPLGMAVLPHSVQARLGTR